MLYPLKFKPILKQTIWGGNKLSSKNEDTNFDCSCIGESWEISAIQDNVSVVSEGILAENTLEELIEIYMGDLVGDNVYEKFGVEFPLLIKYIDACDDLSIQVHPDDKVAKERHKAYGKTEMWYIVDAEPDAHLLLGFNKDTDKTEYLTKLREGSLPEILNVEHVKKGDCFFIPAGTVHAIGKGCLIAEIQQTSDITYRIYDYQRKDKEGNERELHTELATDVINYEQQTEHSISYDSHANSTENLVSSDYFTTNYLKFTQKIEKEYYDLDSFVVYMCLKGKYVIQYNTDEKIVVNQGETLLLPAILKDIILYPLEETEMLEIYIE